MKHKINGVNLGNWLVLEKWMNPAVFAGTTAEDEYNLARQLSPALYEARVRVHRSEYIAACAPIWPRTSMWCFTTAFTWKHGKAFSGTTAWKTWRWTPIDT